MSEDNDAASNRDSAETESSDVRTEELDRLEEDDGDDREPAGMRGYESEHNPGERVRVARMTEDLKRPPTETGDEEESNEEEGEADGEGASRFDVTVRGEGPAEEESPEAASGDSDADGAPDGEAEEADATREDGTAEKGDSAGADGGAGGDGGAGADGAVRAGGADRTAHIDESSAAEEAVEMEFDDSTESVEEFDPDFEVDAPEESGATTEDFAQMFEDEGVPEKQSYSSGDRVEGEVLEVGDRFIFVQLDPQTEGAAKRREFEDDEGQLEVEVGERAEFYVTYADEDEVQLGRQLKGDQGSIDAIREARENGVPVEGKVTGTNKGGFEIEVHGVDAFCPISAIELGFTEEKDVHVGATYRFKVAEVREGGETVVLNRADLLQEERAEKARETLERLGEGEVVEGVVTRTTNFGAFVDLGGIEGLVHISELSHRHFDRASEVVEEGERVEVEILEIGESEEGEEQPRISLSRKAVEQDPWAAVNEQFAVGEKVEGRVVRNAPFGAFIEIAPGVEGLCHVSEMSWTEHVRTPDDVVEPGDRVTVQIQDIDIANQRIGLSIREAEGDPWDDVAETYSAGMEVEGTVENIEDFGAFVQLPTGITALIPRSEMNLPSGVTPHRKYDQDEQVTAEIINIDPAERKMALSPESGDGPDQQASEEEEGREPSEAPDAAVDSGSSESFGKLGDLIGDQIQDEE